MEVPLDIKDRIKLIEKLEKKMKNHAKNLDFEQAMEIRDFIKDMRKNTF